MIRFIVIQQENMTEKKIWHKLIVTVSTATMLLTQAGILYAEAPSDAIIVSEESMIEIPETPNVEDISIKTPEIDSSETEVSENSCEIEEIENKGEVFEEEPEKSDIEKSISEEISLPIEEETESELEISEIILAGEETYMFNHADGDVEKEITIEFREKEVLGTIEVSVEQMRWDWSLSNYCGHLSHDTVSVGLFYDENGTISYGTPLLTMITYKSPISMMCRKEATMYF